MALAFLRPTDFVRSQEALQRRWSDAQKPQPYTRWLATHHYENFHVVSFLLPKRLHQDFYNVYAFCRWADDLGDEIGDTQRSLQLLAWWREQLYRMYDGTQSIPSSSRFGSPRRHAASDAAVRRSDQCVRAGPDGHALRDLGRRLRLLPLSRRTRSDGWCCICADTRMSNGSRFRTPPAPHCNSQISGRTSRFDLQKGSRLHSARGDAPARLHR